MEEVENDLSFFAPALPEDLASSLSQLTKRQQLFVDGFEGDVVFAMRMAGYQGTDEQLRSGGYALLKHPKIVSAMKARGSYEERRKTLVANRDERMTFLSSVMRNADPYGVTEKDEFGKEVEKKNIPLAQRLKAAELLGKAHGDFVETVNVNHTHTISELILKSFDDTTPIEAIEAEYKKAKEQEKISVAAEPLPTLGDLI